MRNPLSRFASSTGAPTPSSMMVVAAVFVAVAGMVAVPQAAVPEAMAVPPVDCSKPIAIPPPVALPVQRPMPADPSRFNAIGGAKVSSSTPQGETYGQEPPLAAQVERDRISAPMFAKDGIFAPTAHPNKQVSVHLPDELRLAPAAWTGNGGAIYGSNDVEYEVVAFDGGGADFVIRRKTIFSSSEIPIGIKMPDGTHLRQGNNVVLVETDPSPGRPARTIGTFSIPSAYDDAHVQLDVRPSVGPGFPPGQSNFHIELGPANIWKFPVTITLAYRPSDVPATGALYFNWEGLPPASPLVPALPPEYITDPAGLQRPACVDPAVYAQRHTGNCMGGPNEFSLNGRTAYWQALCQVHQLCLGTTPTYNSLQSCNDRLLANLSLQCTATFGQSGDEYDACTRAASDMVRWVKENMLPGPG